MHFRNDIQVLRGVSVLLVLLFHLGFEFFGSGFLGVDVFFVISGFLMAVLYREGEAIGFLKRRALRLLPSYYIIIIFTLLLTVFLTTRNESDQVFEQAYFSSVFSPNIGFWTYNSYFSQKDFTPLLHLWSLGVEIQFYLVVPLVAWLARKSRWLLIGLALASFMLCVMVATKSPKTSFFITPFRIWEFLVGYGSALWFSSKGAVVSDRKSYFGLLGLLVVLLIPLIPVDGESGSFTSGHPGLSALVVVLATALVLIYGLPKRLELGLIGRGLAGLGRYSYSIYLVHFPVIVIYNSEPFEGNQYGSDSLLDLFSLLLIISVCSLFFYHGVERRSFSRYITDRWMLSAVCASAFIVLLAVSVDRIQWNVLKEPERRIFSARKDRDPHRCGKLIKVTSPHETVCELTGLPLESTSGRVMLAGNSHADSIKSAFLRAAHEHNLNLFFFVSNKTLNRDGPRAGAVVGEAAKRGVSTIFVHQSAQSFDAETLKELVSSAKSKSINVVYIEPVPVWGVDVPKGMWQAEVKGGMDFLAEMTASDYYSYNESIFYSLDSIDSDNFSRIGVVDVLCNPVCSFKDDDGYPLYFDSHHLTVTGASSLYPVFKEALSKIEYTATN